LNIVMEKKEFLLGIVYNTLYSHVINVVVLLTFNK